MSYTRRKQSNIEDDKGKKPLASDFILSQTDFKVSTRVQILIPLLTSFVALGESPKVSMS